jgi:hypothetical protein
MSRELLKVALQQPEKIASPLAKSLISAAGSGLGATGTFKLLSALHPELAEAALWGGVGAGGVLGHDVARHLANKAKVAAWAKKKAAMEKPFKSEYPLVKKANLSRAAKGAIGLPAAVGTVGAMLPAKTLGIAATLASHGKQIDPSILQKFLQPSKQLGELISAGHLPAGPDALLGLGTLAALGAGAGKLSEKVIPVAKKSITDNPTARKAALAAALFPWTLAAGGGAYLLGKNNSDS